MLRKILLAGSVALPLGLIGTTPALADTDVEVHFGIPFYTYQVGPHYRYYEDYGWYDAHAHPRFRSTYYDDDAYVVYERDYVSDDDDDDYVVISPEP